MKEETKSKIIKIIHMLTILGLVSLIFVSVFLLCHATLLSPDDYNYTFVQGRPDAVRVNSISACIETAKYFYFNWTGRVIPHVLVGIFRNINPYIFEVVNSAVFVIYLIAVTKVLNKKTSYLSILACFGYLAYSKMFGEKVAWISGSCNYMWSCAFLAVYIYVFYNYFIDEKKLKTYQCVLLVIFAFFAGNMHENTAFVGGAFSTLLLLINIKKFWKFEKKKKIFIALTYIFFCIGAFVNIFAPGNLTRMENPGGGGDFLNNFKINKWPIISVFISIFLMYILKNLENIKKEGIRFFSFKNWKNHENKELIEEVLFFILPTIIAVVPMAIIKYFPERAFLAYETMLMIVLAKNVQIIGEHIENEKRYDVVIAGVSIACTLFVFAKFSPSTLADINYLIPYKDKITYQMEDAQAKGEKDVVVSSFEYGQWIHGEDYINISNFFPVLDYHMPTNQLMCKYYSFDRLTAIRDDEYLIEVTVDTEGINPYDLIDIENGENVGHMEYDNCIRYTIPKNEFKKYKLILENVKVLDTKVRSVSETMPKDQFSLEDIVIIK